MDTNGLTLQHLRALRHADNLCFDLDVDNGTSQIRAMKRAENSADGFEQTVYVPAEYNVTDYRRWGSGQSDVEFPPIKYCFESLPGYDEAVKTFVALLRVGDVVRIEWIVNNNSITIDNAKLACDQLSVSILRNGVMKPKYYLRLAHTITDLGSSARMCRTSRYC